jgi:hypothetical protein
MLAESVQFVYWDRPPALSAKREKLLSKRLRGCGAVRAGTPAIPVKVLNHFIAGAK